MAQIETYKNQQDLGAAVAKRRIELGLSQTEVSRALGYRNPNFISMVESGKPIPVNRVIEYALVLEMDPVWLLERVLTQTLPSKIAAYLFNRRTLEKMAEGKEYIDLPEFKVGEGAPADR